MKLIPRDRDERRSLPSSDRRDFMSRFFDDGLWDPFNAFFGSRFPSMEIEGFLPKVNISEDEKNIMIEAGIPGYDPKNVEVFVDENMVTIKGKTEEQKEEKDRRYFRRESSYGEFYREISLPAMVDTSKVTCKDKHGVLMITLPKVESKERKQIPVEND